MNLQKKTWTHGLTLRCLICCFLQCDAPTCPLNQSWPTLPCHSPMTEHVWSLLCCKSCRCSSASAACQPLCLAEQHGADELEECKTVKHAPALCEWTLKTNASASARTLRACRRTTRRRCPRWSAIL